MNSLRKSVYAILRKHPGHTDQSVHGRSSGYRQWTPEDIRAARAADDAALASDAIQRHKKIISDSRPGDRLHGRIHAGNFFGYETGESPIHLTEQSGKYVIGIDHTGARWSGVGIRDGDLQEDIRMTKEPPA